MVLINSTTPQRKRSVRCDGCRMITNLCICHLMPIITTKSRLSLIIQKRELIKPTNTGTLAVKCLTNSEMHIRGRVGEALDYTSMIDTNYENLFLFPNKTAVPLTEDFVNALDKPVKLFVADGNWGQAIRIHRRFMRANNVTSVFLPPGVATQYRLRKENERPEGLATIEAIARAYAVIENQGVSTQLTKIFLTMVDRTIRSRGQKTNLDR